MEMRMRPLRSGFTSRLEEEEEEEEEEEKEEAFPFFLACGVSSDIGAVELSTETQFQF